MPPDSSLADAAMSNDECSSDQDEDMASLVQVIAPVVDMEIEIDDCVTPEVVDATFACAVTGLLEALLPSIFLATKNIHDAPLISFSSDQEPKPVPFDRHVSKRATRKPKHKKPALKGGLPGGATSRASSRAASRFGGSIRAPSLSMRSALFAAKLSKLTRPAVDPSIPFQILPWSDGAHTPLNALVTEHDAWGSNHDDSASLAGSTSRKPVDACEAIRRGEIERDMATREARKRLTQQIQRKAETPLKLRSLEDPSLSLEREEVLRISASRGQSRIGGLRTKTPIQLSSLAKPVAEVQTRLLSAMVSTPALGRVDDDHIEGTYRSEDYRGVSSDVVILGAAGEVLVGENCYLVGRKARSEINQDLSKKANVQPQIDIPAPVANLPEGVANGHSMSEEPIHTTSIAALPVVSLKKSSSKLRVVDTKRIEARPEFEGQLGSFDEYPRLELDPTKTPLAAGVALIGPDGKRIDTKAKVSPPRLKHRQADIPIKSSQSEDKIQPSPSDLPEHPKDDSRHNDQLSVILKLRKVETSPTAPKRLVHTTTKLHSLRTRTPSQERRPPPSKQSRNRFKLAELDEAEFQEHDEASHSTVENSLLPRAKYMREFPGPPSGTIRIFGSVNSESLVDTKIVFPLKPLPSIAKAKR